LLALAHCLTCLRAWVFAVLRRSFPPSLNQYLDAFRRQKFTSINYERGSPSTAFCCGMSMQGKKSQVQCCNVGKTMREL